MKKKLILLFTIIFSLGMLLSCAADPQVDYLKKPKTEVEKTQLLSPEALDTNLKKFLNISDENPNGDGGVRTPYSAAERKAAEFLRDFALEHTQNVVLKEFSSDSGRSQNIIAKIEGTQEGSKQVIIAANYDSIITSQGTILTDTSTITASTGVLQNATGSAVLMSLLEYFAAFAPQTDIVFLFYGAGSLPENGAVDYAYNMTRTEKDNTLLMINLARFGGDFMYVYSEEVATLHNDYIYSAAAKEEIELNKVPVTVPLIEAIAVERIPYATWPMAGGHASFMNDYIPVASVFSGNLNSLAVGDIDSLAKNVSYTQNDNYLTVKESFAEYKNQMSAAARLCVSVLQADDFESTMILSRQQYFDYSFATNTLAAYLTVLGLLAAATIVVVIVAKHFEKKYPKSNKKINLKVAVFGKEYETPSEGDIYIDIKKQEPPDPFI